MSSNSLNKGFVGVPTLISEVLYALKDHETKRYYAQALQKVLNAIRNLNVNYARSYKEEIIVLDDDLKSGKYPDSLVKVISVGVYKHGEYWSFTRKPNMSKTVTGDGETYDSEIEENEEIPQRGVKFGARGSNIGYWVEDDENCRFFVRNYEGLDENGNPPDEIKVVLRYRSNGIDCSTENCIPYHMRDLIIAMVKYDFALMRIPERYSIGELQMMLSERTRYFEEFTDIEYIPQNMDEFLDSQFESYNSTVRR